MRQTLAVISLNLKSIPRRLGMSTATIGAVALVVAVLLGFQAIGNGFRATAERSGAEDIAIMLREGSQAELNSGLSRDQARLIEVADGVARDETDNGIISAELYVIVDGVLRGAQTEANLGLRGMEANGPAMRQGFSLVEGRMFSPGAAELIVGEGVQREFLGFELGQEIRLGTNNWTVVGIFSTGGTVFDSEVWSDLGVLQNLYQRGSSVQSVRARLTSPDGLERLQAYVENEPRLNLDVQTEAEFFAGQSSGTAGVISSLGWPLSIVMAIGALAGAWNTLYSSVDARAREIATLRAIGFSGFSAFIGTMAEAVMLSAIGGAVGTGIAVLFFNGLSFQGLGDSFTQVVFDLSVTWDSIETGITLAIMVGVFGGIFPAIRAARMPILAVHRG